MLPPDLITPREAATLLRWHITTVYRMIRAGEIPAWRRGRGRYLVSQKDVERLCEPVTVGRRMETPAAGNRRCEKALEDLRGMGLRV